MHLHVSTSHMDVA